VKTIPPEHDAARSLEESFRQLGEERLRQRRATHRPRLTGSALALAGVIVCIGAAGATGTKVFLADQGTQKPDDGIPERLKRAPADRLLAQARAADPRERQPWGVRAYVGRTGDACVLLGRVVGARLGEVRDGHFSEAPAGAPAICSPLEDHTLVAIRKYASEPLPGGRTVVYGVVDRTITRLSLRALARPLKAIPIATDGSFVLVMMGAKSLRHTQLRIQHSDGRVTSRILGY
jgi:hypothetical protein